MVTLRDEPERLGINVLDELFAFHRRYYSANLMRLVVLGREPLDQLQSWVDEKCRRCVMQVMQVLAATSHVSLIHF